MCTLIQCAPLLPLLSQKVLGSPSVSFDIKRGLLETSRLSKHFSSFISTSESVAEIENKSTLLTRGFLHEDCHGSNKFSLISFLQMRDPIELYFSKKVTPLEPFLYDYWPHLVLLQPPKYLYIGSVTVDQTVVYWWVSSFFLHLPHIVKM